MAIRELQTAAAHVVFLPKPSRHAVEEVGRRWHYHPLDLEKVLAVAQRSSVSSYGQYVFLTLLWPSPQRTQVSELKFFIDRQRVVILGDTVDQDAAAVIDRLANSTTDSVTPVDVVALILRQALARYHDQAHRQPLTPAVKMRLGQLICGAAEVLRQWRRVAAATETASPEEQADVALLAHQLEQVTAGAAAAVPEPVVMRATPWLNGYAVASAITVVIVILALSRLA